MKKKSYSEIAYKNKPIDIEEEQYEKIRKNIIKKLKDLTKKIKTNEDMPELKQDYTFLVDVHDSIDEILNNWYY